MSFENENTEGATAKAIEEQISKIPSDVYLYASLAAMGHHNLKIFGYKLYRIICRTMGYSILLLGI